MAGLGRFPGVDLPPRRRKRTQRHEVYANYREPPPREWLEPSVNQVSSIDWDDAAHRARRRLEKKLGYHKPSSRSRKGTASSNSKLLGGVTGLLLSEGQQNWKSKGRRKRGLWYLFGRF
ncbi:uncharacterized protein LOC125471594 [Pyrus x bretschneideri]|uniref:uncharacterized protein LOC125471594 n=1 Tax=Pyrus x bretschneideri TaxID=225117 RepID=UPI00202F45E5|nr:uncharacterized protein LOC125471594 [Pyrus x bretschneideri]